MSKLTSLMAEVELVLRSNEKSRNDDTVLTVRIWKRHDAFGKNLMMNIGDIYSLPRASTIERCRRKIQQNAREAMALLIAAGFSNEYLKIEMQPLLEVMPTDPKVIAQRKFGEDAWRSWANEN